MVSNIIASELAKLPYLELTQATKHELPFFVYRERYTGIQNISSKRILFGGPRDIYFEVLGVPGKMLSEYYRIKLDTNEETSHNITLNLEQLQFVRRHGSSGWCCAVNGGGKYGLSSDGISYDEAKRTVAEWGKNLLPHGARFDDVKFKKEWPLQFEDMMTSHNLTRLDWKIEYLGKMIS